MTVIIFVWGVFTIIYDRLLKPYLLPSNYSIEAAMEMDESKKEELNRQYKDSLFQE